MQCGVGIELLAGEPLRVGGGGAGGLGDRVAEDPRVALPGDRARSIQHLVRLTDLVVQNVADHARRIDDRQRLAIEQFRGHNTNSGSSGDTILINLSLLDHAAGVGLRARTSS